MLARAVAKSYKNAVPRNIEFVFKMAEKKRVFVRDATGLVREAGLLDILQFNAVSVTGVSIVSGSMLLLPLITSGSGIWQSITIGFILALFVNTTYYALSVTIPRSGGDYIYISRLLHPALGVLSAGLTGIFGALILSSTFGATVWVTAGVGPLLSIIGRGDLAGAVSTSTALTTAGILSTAFFGALLIFGGNRAFFRLNNVLYAIAILGVIVGAGAFLVAGHGQFLSSFDAFAQPYQTSSADIMTTANSLGFKMPGDDMGSVMIASAILFTSFYWATQSAYLGGEIKHTRTTHFWGMIGSSILWFALTLFAVAAAYYTVGPELSSAASFLNFFHADAWKIPSISFFALYANIASRSVIAAILISLAFIFGYITVTGWSFVIFSRAVFALSFDRFLPAGLADINERYHTPVKALVTYGIFNVIFLVLLIFPSTAVTLYTYAVGLNVVYMLSFFFASIALVVLPYKSKDLFQTSCPIKQRIGGVPLVSIIGVISAVLLVYYEYVVLANPVYFGVTANFLTLMVGFIVFFLVLYFAVSAYRKSKGIDLGLVYKEIPPE
jgi:amino acid transporter